MFNSGRQTQHDNHVSAFQYSATLVLVLLSDSVSIAYAFGGGTEQT